MEMQNYNYFPENLQSGTKAMVFIDGENLAIQFTKLREGVEPRVDVVYEPNIFVWSKLAQAKHTACEIVRRYYYTCIKGDEPKIDSIIDQLKQLGIEAPRVFKKKKDGRSKRVDITLATEMLSHAHRKNYDIAVLVAGDEDYVPLVEAVQAEGGRVVLWFFKEGLSPNLHRAVDYCFNIGRWFFP